MPLQPEIILDSLEDAVICVDDTWHVIFLNAAAHKLFDCEDEKVAGQPMALYPKIEAILGQLDLSAMHLSADSPKGVRRLQGPKAGGESLALEAAVTCVASGAKYFYIVDIRDISSQQQMEKALYQSRKNQAMSALTSGIAHDFKNVLTVIISQLELALSSSDLPESFQENLDCALMSARRGSELVNKLQGFSRQTKSTLVPTELPDVMKPVASGKERILVVDDEDLVRKVLRAVLAYQGYQITEATNAEEALQKYFEAPQQYDLVVMDHYMPEMTGRDALLRIRRSNPSARAIMLSATLPEHESAPEFQGIRYLQKPFENKELLRLVREVLDVRID
jgi:PAS domain S-box-containing protein